MIIVGITWGGSNPNYDQLSMSDLSPTAIAQIPGKGQGEAFLKFLKTELLPFVEKNYPASAEENQLKH
jgi:predicted alpha/beta superfamily hydrolase